MACAQTGSGKTGAFAVPILHQILEAKMNGEGEDGDNDDAGSDAGSERSHRGPRACCTPKALVVCPTRELAMQIQRNFIQLAKDLPEEISCQYAVGGHAVRAQLERIDGCDVLIATPGRLVDFVNKGKVKIDKLKFLVLDEADMMMEMGFNETLMELAAKMPDKENRQTSLFSATFKDDIQKICIDFLKNNYYWVRWARSFSQQGA